MSAFSGPEISSNGLVFYYDSGNTLKSWKGAPTTNLVNPSWASWSVDGSGQGNIGTRTISNTYECTIVDSNANTRQSIYIESGITASTTYTFSVQYKKIYGAPTLRFQIQAYNGATYLSTMSFATTAQLGIADTEDWQTAQITLTTPASTNRILWFMQDGDDYTTYTHSFSLKNVQCEQQSFATPFVDGTRSNTQTLLDLTGQNVITAQSLTYASDNTFSFSAASSNYIDSGYDLSWNNTNSASIDFWCRPTTTSQNVGIIGKGSDWEWQVRQNGDAVQFVYWDTGGSHNNGPIPIISSVFAANVWKHIAVVWAHTANQLYIYANGVLISTSNWTNASINANKSNTVKIGGLIYDWLGGGSYWSGSLAAVKLYSIALSPSEIQQNFNALRGRFGI